MYPINCVGVILAGGKSERMGQPKGLLDFFDDFWLVEQLKRLKSAGIRTVYIGLGFHVDEYFKAMPFLDESQKQEILKFGLNLNVVVNKNPELGSFSTFKKVLEVIPKPNDVLVVPIDVPLLNSLELNNLMHQKGAVVKPQFQNKTGHPIVLKKQIVTQLLNLPQNIRLDYFINTLPKSKLKLFLCNDSQISININTPNIWNAYKTEFIKRKDNKIYKSKLSEGPPPIPSK